MLHHIPECFLWLCPMPSLLTSGILMFVFIKEEIVIEITHKDLFLFFLFSLNKVLYFVDIISHNYLDIQI